MRKRNTVKTKGSDTQKVVEYEISTAPTRVFYIGSSYDGNANHLTRIVAWTSEDALRRHVENQTSLYSSTEYLVIEADCEEGFTSEDVTN